MATLRPLTLTNAKDLQDRTDTLKMAMVLRKLVLLLTPTRSKARHARLATRRIAMEEQVQLMTPMPSKLLTPIPSKPLTPMPSKVHLGLEGIRTLSVRGRSYIEVRNLIRLDMQSEAHPVSMTIMEPQRIRNILGEVLEVVWTGHIPRIDMALPKRLDLMRIKSHHNYSENLDLLTVSMEAQMDNQTGCPEHTQPGRPHRISMDLKLEPIRTRTEEMACSRVLDTRALIPVPGAWIAVDTCRISMVSRNL